MSDAPKPAPAPRKRLPVRPSLEHLRKQAKRLAKANDVALSDAQHRLAADYGCRNWAELAQVVETMGRGADQLVNVDAGSRPLPAAVRARDVERVKAILASGDFTPHDLDAGLAHAAWYGGDAPEVLRVRKQLFGLLLDHGADPDAQYGSAYGPIVFGTGECLSVEGLQWLIEAGCDVTFPPVETKYGMTYPLLTWLGTYARGHNDARHRGIDLLLKHGAYIPPDVTPPILAIHRGDVAELAKLLDADSSVLHRRFPDMPTGNISLKGATLLHCAVEQGELGCVDLLLERGADVNAKTDPGGVTPIYHAISTVGCGNEAGLDHLVARAGSQIDMTVRATFELAYWTTATDVTPLEFAEMTRRPDAPDWRRASDHELAILRGLALRGAAAEGNVTEVRNLLAAPRETAGIARRFVGLIARAIGQSPSTVLEFVDLPDADRNTPLWLACRSDAPAADRIEIARLLLEAGANPRRECSDQSTPLHAAAWRGPIGMVELLLRHEAKEWQGDRGGKLPLDYARGGVAPDRDAIARLLDRPVIDDPNFRAAVAAIHTGDLIALKSLLAAHPNLARDRAIEPDCYVPGYFKDPKLLWFVANNPNQIETMPRNTVDLAAAIIDAGVDAADLDYTLGLVMTSTPAQKQGLRLPLIELLLARGATVSPKTIYSTLGHCEREAIETLLAHGQPMTAPIAAGLNRLDDLARLLPQAKEAERQAAFSMAVINSHPSAVRLCIDAGADVNAFLIVHAHGTAAHHAAGGDDVETLKLLVAAGAKLDVRDKLWGGTPLGWAVHQKKAAAEAYLRASDMVE
jgi:ankyrin repeat protein